MCLCNVSRTQAHAMKSPAAPISKASTRNWGCRRSPNVDQALICQLPFSAIWRNKLVNCFVNNSVKRRDNQTLTGKRSNAELHGYDVSVRNSMCPNRTDLQTSHRRFSRRGRGCTAASWQSFAIFCRRGSVSPVSQPSLASKYSCQRMSLPIENELSKVFWTWVRIGAALAACAAPRRHHGPDDGGGAAPYEAVQPPLGSGPRPAVAKCQ